MVSEIMLQQTQVLRVTEKYREFVKRYPTIKDLALASAGDVLRLWKGMGYNKRALYLHKSAKVIVEDYHGKFPDNEIELVKLPGLGIYTARAILVFAYKQNIACVDTNIRQIITHFFFQDVPQKPSVIQSFADQLVPKGKSWEWHQALMDYGATHGKELRIKNKELRKKRIPFKQTNRFFRGRIIDELRNNNITESYLINKFQRSYNKSSHYTKDLLIQLEKEGLIRRFKCGQIALPS
jgi:A/G-specific adenine glycosylase